MIRYAVFAVMALLVIPVFSAFAEDEEGGSKLGPVPNLSGQYENPEAEFKIVLPEGWTGVQTYGGFVVVSPQGATLDFKVKQDVAMSILPLSRVAYLDSLTKYTPAPVDEDHTVCSITDASYTTINQVSVRKSIQQCDERSVYQKSYAVEIITDKNYIAFVMSAKTAELYDNNVAAFEKSLESLEVKGAQDFRSSESSLLQLQDSYPVVTLNEKKTDVLVNSNVPVTGFGFDEQKKQVSFHIEGKKDIRSIVAVEISKVLEGPFAVLVDGKPTTTFAAISSGDAQFLRVYFDDASHDVTVIGTKVVPEFPTVLVGVLASVMGAVILLSRRFGRRA